MKRNLQDFTQKCRFEIGENMRKLRRRKGLTQEAIANTLGCSRRRINRAEAGHIELAIGELLLLSKTLDAPFYELVGLSAEEMGVQPASPKRCVPSSALWRRLISLFCHLRRCRQISGFG